MNLGQLGRSTWRELRGARSRAAGFVASLVVGVAAVVLVAGLGDGLARAIRMEARPLLGADVAARSFEPLPASVSEVASAFPEAERVDTIDLLTMAAVPPAPGEAPGRSLIVELKAVGAGWPWYGAPELLPPGAVSERLDAEGVLVEPALLERLDLQPGATVKIGAAPFVVRGQIVREPGRLPGGLVAGPRVLMSLDGLARAGLGAQGVRVTHRALFRLPDETRAAELAARLGAELGTRARIETWSDAQPAAQRSIERTTAWLGLVALLSLVVGGVGVAQATRAWMAHRLDAIAIQRTLGLTASEVGAAALGQATILAVLGSAAGGALGMAALACAPVVLAELLPAGAVEPWQPAAVVRGVALGVGMALLFAWRPLARAVRVPPLRVLRRDVEPLPESRLQGAAAWGGIALGVWALAWVQVQDPAVAGLFVAGLGAVAGVGALAAAAAARGLGRLARGAGRWWLRHGLASLGRPGSGVVPAVVSLALGVMVVLTTVLVEGRLYAQIAQEFPANAPSAFLLDVQPDQRMGVEAALAEAGATHTRSVPVVVGRILAVDGVEVDALAERRPEDERWQLTREQRLSYMAALPPDNRIVEGGPFSPEVASELSIERSYAEGLGAKLGSRVRFDVQGVPVELVVTSIRTVSWESFNMNFFLVVEPGVLESAPQTHLVTTQLDAEREGAAQDALAARFPNVTLVSVRAALAQARGLLEKLGWGVRVIGTFTAAAGVAILAVGVAADAARRGRQVALLKTLGTTRAGVAGVLGVEYALVGLMAGLLGSAGAVGLSYGLVTRLMHLPWKTDLGAVGLAVLAAGASCVAVGLLANTHALRVRPGEVLRGE